MGRSHGRVVYAALGDSMSIDDYAGGPGRGAASLLWRNRDDDFPGWAGRDLTARDATARLALLASDGATSATVAGEQLARLHRLGLTPTLATVTMGGNDLLAAYGDTAAASQGEGFGAGLEPVGVDLLAVVSLRVGGSSCTGGGRGRGGGQHHQQQRGGGRSPCPERCHDVRPPRKGWRPGADVYESGARTMAVR
jgi:hypothetical protein